MTNERQWSHDQQWSPDPDSVGECRRFVRRYLATREYAGISEDVALVVSELATNVVRHAKTPFRVTVLRSGKTVTVRVSDESSHPPEPYARDSRRTTGRGLKLVSAVSQAWGVSRMGTGGKVVWASFQIEPAPVLEPAHRSAHRA